MRFDDGAPQQLSLNLGPQPRRPGCAPKFQQRVDLFFAIYLDAIVAIRVVKLARALCNQFQLSGRLRPKEILHVTLVPVGISALLPREAFSVLGQAAALVDQAAFKVIFDHVVSFKNGDNCALVLRCSDGVSTLKDLRKSLHAALAGVGFRAPSSFTPHVTLAYCRGSISETALVDPVVLTVREFVLVQSLHGKGVHIPLARWPLRV